MNAATPVTDEILVPESRAKLDAKLAEVEESLAVLGSLAAGPKQNKASRGPRNLPKPDARKAHRQRVRAARRGNR